MSKIERVENRIRQIEKRIEKGPSINSEAFQKLMVEQSDAGSAKFGARSAAPGSKNLMPQSHFNLSIKGRQDFVGSNRYVGGSADTNITPLAQSNSVSCGQTSVAMCLNSISGGQLTDMDIDAHYGFRLLDALKAESQTVGVDWEDAGNIGSHSWSTIDKKVNQEGLPVIVALNGPEFSPSGRGHIVTITKTTADTVTYADPADGKVKTTSKRNMERARSHPDGNFVFVANRTAPPAPPVTPYAMMNNTNPLGMNGVMDI